MPRVVALVEAPRGRLALATVFTALLGLAQWGDWWLTGLFVVLLALFPERKKALLALGAAAFIVVDPPLSRTTLSALAGPGAPVHLWPLALMGVWLIPPAYVWLVQRHPNWFPARWPALGLLALLVALMAATRAPLSPAAFVLLAAAAMILGRYLWFFSYAIAAARGRDRTGLVSQFAFIRPFWGFTHVPFPKGAAHLLRIEARTEAQLTTAQLKGLKLLLWALLLGAVRIGLDALRGGHGDPLAAVPGWPAGGVLPTLGEAFSSHLAGRPLSLPMRWLALVGEFLRGILSITISGHFIIATCRMAGFMALRNTCRPLASTSVAEFFNRLYYYFKELLVEFFFFPTYLRMSPRHPRLRLFVATFAAAGLGNFLYHFLRDDVLEAGFARALSRFAPFSIYVLILATGIAVSQVRNQSRGRHRPAGARRVFATLAVLMFYCLLTVFDHAPRSFGVGVRCSFGVSLFRP